MAQTRLYRIQPHDQSQVTSFSNKFPQQRTSIDKAKKIVSVGNQRSCDSHSNYVAAFFDKALRTLKITERDVCEN